jgi:hypothetical protein
MPVICPKCSHVRPADATNPDWQCPACGICYAKFGSQPAVQVRPVQYGGIEHRQGWNLGWLLKIVLLVALGWGIGVLMERRQKAAGDEEETVAALQAEPHESGLGVAVANTALRVSEADATMLHSLSGRLERGCARNKYGLSEQACVARLREREDGCAAQTAQRFPGQIGNTDRMQVITQAYVACIFEDEEGR